MQSIFMVHSVLAIDGVGKLTRDLNRDENSSGKKESQESQAFSDILRQEVEEMRTDLHNYSTVTYGMDRKLHRFEYLTREYR